MKFGDTINSLESALKLLSLPEALIDDEVTKALWYWLDQQSAVKQWEIIEQFAKVRPLNLVLDVWGE